MSWATNVWAAMRGKGAPGVAFADPNVTQAAYELLAGAVPWGVPPDRGERELLIAQRKVPTLHVVTKRIAESVAAVPWQLLVARDKGGKPEKRRSLIQSPYATRRKMLTKGDGTLRDDVTELQDHPLLDLWDKPNPVMSGQAFRALMQMYLLLKGEFYGIIERNNLGMPIQIWPVPGFWCFRTPYEGDPFFHFNYGTWVADIPERDVIWIKHLRTENPYFRGAGTGESLGDEIDIDAYAAKTQKAFFYNNGTPAGIARIDGLGKDELKRTREDAREKISGYWNANKVMWTNGEIDWKSMAPTFSDSQIMELRKASRDTLVHTYGVPPEILGIIEHSNKATISAATYIFAEQCLKPELEFMRCELQERLVPEFDDRLLLEYISPTPDDQTFEMEVGKVAPWTRSTNEWRKLQNLPPIEGKDDEFSPMLAPPGKIADAAGNEPPAPPPPTPPKDYRHARPRHKRGARRISEAEVDLALEQIRPEDLTEELDGLMGDELKSWSARVAKENGIEISFSKLNPAIVRHLEEFAGDRIGGMINETTKDALREALVEGVQAGEGIDELAKRVEEAFDDAEGARAELIARTEVTRSSNWGTTEAFRVSGVVERRQWVATQDSRTRDSHAEMDGQEVGIDEEFTSPDGGEADYPGDFGDPEEDCNCRCTTVAVIREPGESDEDDEDEKAMRTKAIDRAAAWKAFDRALVPWESAFKAALRRGFRNQRAAVLSVLQGASPKALSNGHAKHTNGAAHA